MTANTRKRIAILFHEDDAARTANYLVSLLATHWREDGHEVVYVFGASKFVPADLVLVHVDLSVVPAEYLELARRYPIALNATVRDIRKSRFSSDLLRTGDPWDGAVIVKSDANCAGGPERLRSRGLMRSRFVRRVARRASVVTSWLGAAPHFETPADYRIYEHLRDVPRRCFRDDAYIVQKFLPERDGPFHCVRNMTFLGRHVTCVRLKSRDPIVSGENAEVVEQVEISPEIAAARTAMGFDYGKFDYVINDGRAVLLDVNKTIGCAATLTDNAVLLAVRRRRAEALYDWFDDLRNDSTGESREADSFASR